jgi:acetyl esterase/lipase
MKSRCLLVLTSSLLVVLCAALPSQLAAEDKAADPAVGTCAMDADGTSHITRTVPMPQTISAEAQKYLARVTPSSPNATLEERRASTDKWRKSVEEKAHTLYPVKIEEKVIGGVRTDVLTPREIPAEKRDRVLINVHGGGFVVDAGSLIEGMPIAYLTKTRVVSVYYRMAPEHPFPAAVDDTVAVYRELLKTHKPKKIALYGTSAGAILTAEVAVELNRLGLPLPGALGMFSVTGDLSQSGDTEAFFTLRGLPGEIRPRAPGPRISPYVGSRNPKDPGISPLYADLKGMPPSLFVASTRDFLLSGTAILHRAYLCAGVDAELVVFEALPHGFWNEYDLPESQEALGIMAGFFDRELSH